jgi:hypothetical protein
MLTDIFADRYAKVPMWQMFTDQEPLLLVQAWRAPQLLE